MHNLFADVAYKKERFIGRVNSIITQFGFTHCVCKLRLIVTRGYSIYASSLWYFYDNDGKHYMLPGILQCTDDMICLEQPIYKVCKSHCNS